MTHQRFNLIALLLSAAGVAFAGYLSAYKFFLGTCAFGETCPIFFGYPACYFGLAIFAAMFIPNLVAFIVRSIKPWRVQLNLWLSIIGTIYAAYMLYVEVSTWGLKLYGMGLPTCAYGTIFFLAILVFTLIARKKLVVEKAAPAPAVPTVV